MADVQKPVAVPETTPTVTESVAEPTPVETTTAPATTEAAPVETATETPAVAETPAEEPKKEVKPIEEGHLEHKAAPASFPKNLIYSKQNFWFGNDAVPSDKLSAYIKGEKTAEVAHHVAAWASHTGKGLLFYGKDTKTPHGAIQLSEATEPKTDGLTKFSVVSKGHKHTFKASTPSERDNWVSQLKLKIAEAKELAVSITETETYKSTLESFKPKPVVVAAKKEEKPVVPETTEETPATTEAAVAETPAVEETKEEKKVEEPKRRSASRKRASIFGSFQKKKEEVKETKEAKKEETPVAATETAVEPVETPAETTTAAAATTETAAVEEPTVAAEEKPVEAVKETKPTPSKRNSIFGGLSFGSKKKAETETTAPVTPPKDTTTAPAVTEPEPVAETAPVIPAVETTAPLSAEVASPTTVPTETVDATPAATNGESKKEVKSEKRKSSLPFAFGSKKEKSASSDEEGEKAKSPPLFARLRQTVKQRTSSKSAEKPAVVEKAAEEKPAETAAETSTAAETTETPKVAEVPAVEETKPVAPPASTPVTAAA